MPRQAEDLTNQKFGRWTVISRAGSTKDGTALWKCKCSCGTEREVRSDGLRKYQSCGCVQREKAKETAATLHKRRRKVTPASKTHGMSKTPEYRAWNQMIQRCTNPKLRNYDRYGGRGISVCDEWMRSFESFYKDVGPRPSENHSLDRIDNEGNYEPGNVRWSTDSEQLSNTHRTRRFDFSGDSLTLAEISRRTGIKYRTLRFRIVEMGWSVERATTQDPRLYHGHQI